MKKIKISKKFFTKEKEQMMKKYKITEDEYKYILDQGMRKDEEGNLLSSFEVEIPDNLHAITMENVSQVQSKKNSKSSDVSKALSVANVSSDMINRQQSFNQQIAHDYLEQAHQYLDLALKCKQNPDSTFEEYAAYLAMSREAEEKAERYYLASNTPMWNETTVNTVVNIDSGSVNTHSRMVNTPMSKFTSGLSAIQSVISIVSNTLEVLRTFGIFLNSRRNKK